MENIKFFRKLWLNVITIILFPLLPLVVSLTGDIFRKKDGDLQPISVGKKSIIAFFSFLMLLVYVIPSSDEVELKVEKEAQHDLEKINPINLYDSGIGISKDGVILQYFHNNEFIKVDTLGETDTLYASSAPFPSDSLQIIADADTVKFFSISVDTKENGELVVNKEDNLGLSFAEDIASRINSSSEDWLIKKFGEFQSISPKDSSFFQKTTFDGITYQVEYLTGKNKYSISIYKDFIK